MPLNQYTKTKELKELTGFVKQTLQGVATYFI